MVRGLTSIGLLQQIRVMYTNTNHAPMMDVSLEVIAPGRFSYVLPTIPNLGPTTVPTHLEEVTKWVNNCLLEGADQLHSLDKPVMYADAAPGSVSFTDPTGTRWSRNKHGRLKVINRRMTRRFHGWDEMFDWPNGRPSDPPGRWTRQIGSDSGPEFSEKS